MDTYVLTLYLFGDVSFQLKVVGKEELVKALYVLLEITDLSKIELWKVRE